MTSPPPVCNIAVSPDARSALERLQSAHGNIILHVTGGCCDARTPLCLPLDELRLGERDVLLGMAGTVPVYEMQSTLDNCPCCGAYLLDVRPGVPVGFSLDPGLGLRFTIREVVTPCPAQDARNDAADELKIRGDRR